MVISVLKRTIMKKTYMTPAMEVVMIKTSNLLMTSNLSVDSDITISHEEILAPELSAEFDF